MTVTRTRRVPAAIAVAILALASIRPVDAQEAPALPPPPVTVQDVVNQLLPLIRQLDPLMAQLTPVIGEVSRPLLEQGGAAAAQLDQLATQLEPLVSAAAPIAEVIAGVLGPIMETVDAQISPQLALLLEALGPYINQVDLATAFQVIGPLAPTAVQAIPTLNKFYDSIDVIGPVRDPLTCPIARAIPSQPILDIVVPFLCYDTIVQGNIDFGDAFEPGQGGSSSPPPPPQPDVVVDGDSVEAREPSPSGDIVLGGDPPESRSSTANPGAGSAIGAPSTPVGSGPGTMTSSTDETAAVTLPAAPASSDGRVETLEGRLRLMFLFLSGLGLLLWDFFRRRESDGLGGLGIFRSARTGEPPPIL